MTTDSIIFSNPAVREVPIPIEDIVNGTIFLAQLLSAGQVKRKPLAFFILLFLSNVRSL
jgi:hypothetical protein